MGYWIKQYDVETAFLYGKLTEKVYMKIPSGVDADDEYYVKPDMSRSQSSDDRPSVKSKWKRNDLTVKLKHSITQQDQEFVNQALMASPELSELKFEDDSLVNSMERADMDFEQLHGRKTESESEDTLDAM
jgi:hypothetical protein